MARKSKSEMEFIKKNNILCQWGTECGGKGLANINAHAINQSHTKKVMLEFKEGFLGSYMPKGSRFQQATDGFLGITCKDCDSFLGVKFESPNRDGTMNEYFGAAALWKYAALKKFNVIYRPPFLVEDITVGYKPPPFLLQEYEYVMKNMRDFMEKGINNKAPRYIDLRYTNLQKFEIGGSQEHIRMTRYGKPVRTFRYLGVYMGRDFYFAPMSWRSVPKVLIVEGMNKYFLENSNNELQKQKRGEKDDNQ